MGLLSYALAASVFYAMAFAATYVPRFPTYTCLMIPVAVLGTIIVRQYMGGSMYKGRCRIDGKTVIITGANTGIGKVAAKDLAKRGGSVILACRDIEKAKLAREEILSEVYDAEVIVMKLDLASFDSIRSFCKQINESKLKVKKN